MIKASECVEQDESGWRFVCPVTDGTCGDRASGKSFSSSQWPTKKSAVARGEQHFADHRGEPMPTLEEFRAEHNLTVGSDGKVTAEDLA